MLCEIYSLTVECHKGSHCLVPVYMQAQKKCLFGFFDRIHEACRALQSSYDSTNWHWLLVVVVDTKGYSRDFLLLIGGKTMRQFS